MELTSIKGVFLRYILMPLFAVIMMFIMGIIRKNTPAVKLKHIIVYVLLGGLILAIPGFLGFTGNLFNPYWYLGAQVVFLGLGILHVNLLHHYFRKHFTSTTRSIIFDCVLSITCIAFGGYLFVLIFKWISLGLGNPFMAATSMVSFIIPLLFYYCYISFISIPFDIYKTWRYNPDEKPFNFQGVDFDKLMVLNVELSKNLEDQQRFRIKAKTLPTGITYGEWFFRVVDDYNHKNPNSKIQLMDYNNNSYYWIFYIKKSFFSSRKYIDFEKDISSNKISENQVVICKRVIQHQEEGEKEKLVISEAK
ncbi:TssN family type VI secretion system protein [Elizabethkingia anophelis]|uniref:TssN family type VI secretion system protein n=1 Tax=Elizabethkingia anophelis TaxID=1117645 RepID=UPI0021A501F3|nr:TssN family type VI secretion system protein [Elizabethkingia anophelis]MCT3975379.1 TssN family type VI secretion system protein [Elizabethkingia anophelis]MCT4039629.1 TssN family type VI secretion system protein [Elizabethkingia anophelis]